MSGILTVRYCLRSRIRPKTCKKNQQYSFNSRELKSFDAFCSQMFLRAMVFSNDIKRMSSWLKSILSVYLFFSIPPKNNAYYVPTRIQQAKQTRRQVSMVDAVWCATEEIPVDHQNTQCIINILASVKSLLYFSTTVSCWFNAGPHANSFLEEIIWSALKFMMLHLDLEQSASSEYFIHISIKQQLLCISCKFQPVCSILIGVLYLILC